MSKSLGNVVAPQDVIRQSGAEILRLWAMSSDYAEDLRIGPDILKANIELYRKLRNTLRFLLGNLAHYRPELAVARAAMPGLERYMLSRLAELDEIVRAGYDAFDFKRIFHALLNFCVNDLSAFYFDIRKDALYCDPYDSVTRRAALTVLDHVFAALTAWLAPMLCFTMEEAWLNRFPGERGSVHLRQFPEIPRAWRDDALGAQWRQIRDLRRVVTGALEIERKEGRIGSSLEAAPKIYVADPDLRAALDDVDLAEIAITSGAQLLQGEGPAHAFRLDDVKGVAVVFERAKRQKMRPILEDPRRGRQQIPSFPSSPCATRKRSGNSMHAAARGSAMLRNWLWGPMSPLGLGIAALTVLLDQAHKAWMLYVYDIGAQGQRDHHPVLRSRARVESGHQLRAAAAGQARLDAGA